MADVKISELDPAAALDGSELIETVQSGVSVRTTTQDIADLGGGGSSYLVYTALLSEVAPSTLTSGSLIVGETYTLTTHVAGDDFPGAADMTNIIRRERRAELAMEGLRTDDIRRWKTAETVLNGFAHGAKFGDAGVDNGYIRAQKRQFDPAKNYLWPIPASEIGLDPNLTQNPGY